MGIYRLNQISNQFEQISPLTGSRYLFEINRQIYFTLYGDTTLYRLA